MLPAAASFKKQGANKGALASFLVSTPESGVDSIAVTYALLDPIMTVEVLAPESFTGDVIGDLNARGGKIESIEPKAGVQTINATVPLAKMFGYSTDLRSATQGRGTFSMQFSRFDRN